MRSAKALNISGTGYIGAEEFERLKNPAVRHAAEVTSYFTARRHSSLGLDVECWAALPAPCHVIPHSGAATAADQGKGGQDVEQDAQGERPGEAADVLGAYHRRRGDAGNHGQGRRRDGEAVSGSAAGPRLK